MWLKKNGPFELANWKMWFSRFRKMGLLASQTNRTFLEQINGPSDKSWLELSEEGTSISFGSIHAHLCIVFMGRRSSSHHHGQWVITRFASRCWRESRAEHGTEERIKTVLLSQLRLNTVFLIFKN